MTFTEEDLENLGYFKEQLMSEIGRVAAGKGKLYDNYVDVCNEMGVQPSNDLADLLVRVIQDDELAHEISSTDPEIGDIIMNDKRKEDIEFILDLKEEFDIGSSDTGFDVQSLVEQRLETMSSGPLSTMTTDSPQPQQGTGRTEEIMMDIHDRVVELEEEVNGGRPNERRDNSTTDPEDREEEIDGLFGGDDETDTSEPEGDVEDGGGDGVDVVEVESEEDGPVGNDDSGEEDGSKFGFEGGESSDGRDPITPDDAEEGDSNE